MLNVERKPAVQLEFRVAETGFGFEVHEAIGIVFGIAVLIGSLWLVRKLIAMADSR
jgi:hypothetical protein